MDIQKQEGGDNSKNIQVIGDVTYGISYTEARQIALDVFNANCQKMMSEAVQTAEKRANEIVDDFTKKLFEEHPELSVRLKEPSIQYSAFSVIKNYVKTGDTELKERMLRMLIQRMEAKERSMEQIVLDEAIEVLPKLTQDQVNILSLILSAIYIIHNLTNIDDLKDYINDLMGFYPTKKSNSIYTHLQYTGCCSALAGVSAYKPFVDILRIQYGGLFNKGFSEDLFKNTFPNDFEKITPILMKCLQNKSHIQFDAINEIDLKHKINKNHLESFSSQILSLYNQNTMNNDEILSFVCDINPRMKDFLEDWNDKLSELKSFKLTSVGYAIAVLNYNIKTGKNVPLNWYI